MSVLGDLEKLHSAEEFFSYLKVDFDPAILRVARLHILKRMGQYLASRSLDDAAADANFAEAREALAHAYRDFAASSPLAERVFKVLQDHDPSKEAPAKPAPFVPLESLTIVGR